MSSSCKDRTAARSASILASSAEVRPDDPHQRRRREQLPREIGEASGFAGDDEVAVWQIDCDSVS